jgi:hypothetical protein
MKAFLKSFLAFLLDLFLPFAAWSPFLLAKRTANHLKTARSEKIANR